MSRFSKATFNAARYASIRPTYPQQLYDLAYNFHGKHPQAKWETAVDLGCGTGQVTTHLVPKFNTAIGVDPSQGMLDKAISSLSPDLSDKITYRKSTAEDLSFIPSSSVDLVIAAQAAHWFDYPQIYSTLARVLRPETGCFVFWGYSEFRLRKYPSLTGVINAYSKGRGEESVGAYWEQPGRDRVDNHFLDLPPPSEEDYSEFSRVFYTGTHQLHPSLSLSEQVEETHPTILHRTLTWPELEMYFRTFSSLHAYHEAHPQDLERMDEGMTERGVYIDEDGKGKGDIVQRFLGRLQRGAKKEENGLLEEKVDVEWPVAVMMARRR